MSSEDDGLSALTLYDSSDSEHANAASQSSQRQKKLRQTEAQFLAQKVEWIPPDQSKKATERLSVNLHLLLSPAELKIKAEHEYYLRNYPAALCSAQEALRQNDAQECPGLQIPEADRRELLDLVERCQGSLQKELGSGGGERK